MPKYVLICQPYMSFSNPTVSPVLNTPDLLLSSHPHTLCPFSSQSFPINLIYSSIIKLLTPHYHPQCLLSTHSLPSSSYSQRFLIKPFAPHPHTLKPLFVTLFIPHPNTLCHSSSLSLPLNLILSSQ